MLIWNEEKVGYIKIDKTDMWYWDCVFEGNEEIGNLFLSKVKDLKVSETFRNMRMALHATVWFNGDSNNAAKVLVLGFVDSFLILRSIT